MANKKQVDRLRKGAATWNSWRRGRRLFLDLSEADLRDIELHGADLSGADLSDADLSGTNLNEANLRDANLNGVNLTGVSSTGVNLSSTHLVGADLSGADLAGADLTAADLSYATLIGTKLNDADLSFASLGDADLSEANLDGARLYRTVFANVDLTGVIGLEACLHDGPSVIDFGTLAKSHPLPLEFLRGIGLPDTVIDYLPSLLNQSIQYYSCFISYSSKDDDFAQRIHADLQGKGVRCWFAPHDLPIGGRILDEIDAAIRMRDKVLLILSEHSIGSDWVEDEVKTAYEEERRRKQTMLFPIRLDDTVMKTKEAWATKLRADRNIGDFRQWKDHDRYREVFERVLRDLAAVQKKSG